MQDQQRFQSILEAARNRTATAGVDTMVVAAHLAQMRLFMVRQGIEFFARQDSFSQRREFLRRVVDFNELPGRLEAIIDAFLIDGKGLLYFRPSKDLYRIHYFDRDQYRAYYDEEGELEEVQVIYSFEARPPRGFGVGLGTTSLDGRFPGWQTGNELRWIKLRVLADRIEQEVTPQRPEFGDELRPSATQTLVNSLGFIPAVEVYNNRGLAAGSGNGEFDWLASYILQHDAMVKNIKGNLKFFGNPTLVSSRPRHDLLEPDSDTGTTQRATISSNSGFVGLSRASTRVSEPMGGYGGGLRVPRIIANVEAADRVGYIVPDAVSGDLTAHAQAYQESIRAALGGVDDLSISSGATAFEVRTLYGRVAATAKRKCRDLLEYGFCRLFSMMVIHEETLFRESLAQALGIKRPEPLLIETVEPDQREAAEEKYEKAIGDWRGKVNAAIQSIKESGEVAPGVVGLIPDGDARIDWRWQGEVFEDSPQEVLQNSIVCRNLQELGVSSIEALAHLFPQKTPEERAAMLSGYPFRMVEATQRSVGIFSDLVRSMFQVPHPQEPDLPLAADPNLDLVPYLYRTLDFLRKELSYSGKYSDVDPTSIPPTLSDADRLRAQRGEPTELERRRAERRRGPSRLGAPAGDGSPAGSGRSPATQLGFGGPVATGVSGLRRLSDSDVPIPGLGGPLSFDPTRPDVGPGGQLGSGTPAIGGGMGAPDLRAPTNAGLLPSSPDRPADRRSAGGSGRRPGRPR